MSRTQFLAAFVVLGIIGALVVSRVQSGSNAENASAAADSAATDSAAGEADAATPGADGTATNEPDETEQSAIQDTDAADEPTAEAQAAEVPPILDPQPALTDLDGWLNTDATSLDDFAGQVRIVEFWTFGCFNCKNRLPHTQAIYERWHPEGLEIIGVHAPEFDFERDPAAIANASEELGVIWPVALDTRKTNFRAWQGGRRFWPRTYVLDQNGDVRFDHIGEGDYTELEETVAYLIENGP